MKALYTLLILLIPFVGYGQINDTLYDFGNDESEMAYSIAKTNDNGFIICGSIKLCNTCSTDPLLLKINSLGDTIWSKVYDEELSGKNSCLNVTQTNDGGFFMVNNNSIIKTDAEGNIEWRKIAQDFWTYENGLLNFSLNYYYIINTSTIGCDQQTFVYGFQTDDDGYIVLNHGYLIKLNNFGETEWISDYFISEDISGNNWLKVNSLISSSNGNYIIYGDNFGNKLDASYNRYYDSTWFLKILSNDGTSISLNYEWNDLYTVGVSNADELLVQSSNDEIVLLGTTWDGHNAFWPDQDILLAKFDNLGNLIWEYEYDINNGNTDDVGYALKISEDDSYIILASSGSVDNQLILMKVNSDGELLWTNEIAGAVDTWITDFAYSLIVSNNEIIIAGGRYSNNSDNGYYDIWVIKTDLEGNITSNIEIPINKLNKNIVNVLNFRGQKIKPQKNEPIIEIFDDGSIEKKVIIE